MKRFLLLSLTVMLVFSLSSTLSAGGEKAVTGTVKSADGTAIKYEVMGKGEPTLVFVHCWCCNRGFWSNQLSHFAKKYRIVALDLAGHGESGMERKDWSLETFGQDVAAVVNHLKLKKIILLGHSMGGPVVVAAAALMPDKVLGLVGVDTLQDIELKFPKEQVEQFLTPMKADFPGFTRNFVGTMFAEGADPELKKKIIESMAGADKNVGVNSMKALASADIAAIFDKTKPKIYLIASEKRPINYEGGKKHTTLFEAKIMKNVGHFPHMTKPGEFNKLLEEVLTELTKK